MSKLVLVSVLVAVLAVVNAELLSTNIEPHGGATSTLTVRLMTCGTWKAPIGTDPIHYGIRVTLPFYQGEQDKPVEFTLPEPSARYEAGEVIEHKFEAPADYLVDNKPVLLLRQGHEGICFRKIQILSNSIGCVQFGLLVDDVFLDYNQLQKREKNARCSEN